MEKKMKKGKKRMPRGDDMMKKKKMPMKEKDMMMKRKGMKEQDMTMDPMIPHMEPLPKRKSGTVARRGKKRIPRKR